MTDRTRIRRHPERAVPEETADILTQGIVAHVGFSDEDGPVVIPMLYGFSRDEPGKIILHGSRASRLLRLLRDGAPACVTVTLVDGLVYSKSAKFHSANYRSATCFGRAREIEEHSVKERVMAEMTTRYFPDRELERDYSAPTVEQFNEITIVEFVVEESSAKARRGPPRGPDDDDPHAPGTAGILPL